MNSPVPSHSFWKRRISPALALWLLAPVFGELIPGATRLNQYPFLMLLYGMLYGSGALLIREVLIRWGKGWKSLLLLGAAYGIYEEGLMVRSFFDPGWKDLGALGTYGRVAGVNWVWVEHLTIYHALISVAASIAFVEMLYPEKRAERWLGTRGLWWNIVAFAATLPIGGLMDRYNTPDVWLGVCWLGIILLAFAAWCAPAAAQATPSIRVPHPRRFWWIAFLATFSQFFIISFTSEGNRLPFVASMLLIALFDLFLLWLVLRWSGDAQAWDDRHKLALINGSLSFFLILGPLTTQGRYPIMYVSNPIFLMLLWWVAYKVNRRVKAEGQTAAQPSPLTSHP